MSNRISGRRLPGGLLLVAFVLFPPAVGARQWQAGLSGSGRLTEAISGGETPVDAPTVLLVGGVDGDPASADVVRDLVESHRAAPTPCRLIAIPMANPDARPIAFPPEGTAYRDNAEAHALWRWTGAHAPDLVLVVGEDFGLAGALSVPVAGLGRIPSQRVDTPDAALADARLVPIPPSEARLEVENRVARTPLELAGQLAEVYGHSFDRPDKHERDFFRLQDSSE